LEETAEANHLSPAQIIFDPVVPPLSWQDGNRLVREVLETLFLLPDLLGRPVRTIAGLSNLTSGAPSRARRQVVESAFLAMTATAGLSMALLNVFHTETMNAARACRALISEKPFSWAEFGSTAGVK
jgi:5-methyltetrahydrofolate corrinoid/iron sulfur protein methyltransferase